LRQNFEKQFIKVLQAVPFAEKTYAGCFAPDGHIQEIEATKTATSEWQAWVSGAYGVCLRDFTAFTCVQKETLAARAKAHFSGTERLNPSELLELAQNYNSLALPFAPWERPTSSAHIAIDKALAELRLEPDVQY
jgi:hypothetical protein